MNFWKRLLAALGIVSLSASAMAENNLAEQAASSADQAIEIAKKIDGSILDYTPDSLKVIDKIVIGIGRDGTKPEQVERILFVFGTYVGEVIVRNINGSKWTHLTDIVKQEGFTAIGVTTSDGTFWNPIGKVHKLLINGEEDSVAHFYNVVKEKSR